MRNTTIINRYKNGEHAQLLADEYGISARQIQRILNDAGVIRTRSESFILAIEQGRMIYHKKPEHLKAKRKRLSDKVRYDILQCDGFKCVLCGATASDGIRLEIDHIDNDATNNCNDNLQTLCQRCNSGKAHNL